MTQFLSGLYQLKILPNNFSSANAMKGYKARPNSKRLPQNNEPAIQKPIITPKPKNKKPPHHKDKEAHAKEFYLANKLSRTLTQSR